MQKYLKINLKRNCIWNCPICARPKIRLLAKRSTSSLRKNWTSAKIKIKVTKLPNYSKKSIINALAKCSPRISWSIANSIS